MSRYCLECDRLISKYKVRCREHEALFQIRRTRLTVERINRLHREEFGSDPSEVRLP